MGTWLRESLAIEVTIGKSITTKINIASKEFLPVGSVLNKGTQPKKLCKKTKKSLKKGSITNIAHNPNTTEGIAAKSSTNELNISLKTLGTKSSVINIAVPTPNGIVINNERNEVTNVPYIAVKAPYSSFTGFHSEVTRNLSHTLKRIQMTEKRLLKQFLKVWSLQN